MFLHRDWAFWKPRSAGLQWYHDSVEKLDSKSGNALEHLDRTKLDLHCLTTEQPSEDSSIDDRSSAQDAE